MNIPSEPETHMWRTRRPDEDGPFELEELAVGDVVLAEDYIRRTDPSRSGDEAPGVPEETAYWGEILEIKPV